jgi:hypothetical protein
MAKSRSKQTPYAVFGDDPDAPLHVELRRVMNPMVALFDALPLIASKGRTYVRVVDAIAWHEKELKESRGRSGSRETVALLREALDSHRAEAEPARRSTDTTHRGRTDGQQHGDRADGG